MLYALGNAFESGLGCVLSCLLTNVWCGLCKMFNGKYKFKAINIFDFVIQTLIIKTL